MKYLIKFEYDFSDVMSEESDFDIEFTELDDDCLLKMLSTNSEIKEFEDWYNTYDDEPIKLKSYKFNPIDENQVEIIVDLDNDLNESDLQHFANSLLEFLFDTEAPTLYYTISGDGFEDYWDYYHDSPEQRDVDIEEDKSASITKYKILKVQKYENL